MDDKLAILQAKKIGVFIHQARENSGHSVDECAGWLNISNDVYQAIENGSSSPSLPQVESLAYYLKTTFASLIKGTENSDQPKKPFSKEMNDQLINLRTHVIAAMIKQKRIEKGLSLKQLAKSTSIPPDQLESYETGSAPFSLTDLEKTIKKLDLTLESFFSSVGPFNHASNKSAQSTSPLDDLPQELRDFITKPVNRPYLELALHLSQMEADKLRSIAASLLEITY
jgi:transcriptional regulator with XRE-family HTH domain